MRRFAPPIFTNEVLNFQLSGTNSIFYNHEKMTQWTVDEGERGRNEVAPAVKF